MSDEIESVPECLVSRIGYDPDFDLQAEYWLGAEALLIDRYWSGVPAPAERRFEARLLWTEKALLARFDHEIGEPLVVDPEPDVSSKTIGLWERDVCELFISPGGKVIRRYFEFEAAPNGEWLDLSLELTPEGRSTDWEFRSGMSAESRIEGGRVSMAIRIPWTAVGRAPEEGESWRGNVFRAVGSGPDRGYLAWSPTLTETPNFHVPERFGKFLFT